jgi:hypothetical protein
MIQCANLVGFAGQELARKVPHVAGVLIETTLVKLLSLFAFPAHRRKIVPDNSQVWFGRRDYSVHGIVEG